MNSNYNRREKLIAGLLSGNPVLKTFLKRLYGIIVFPLNRKNYTINSPYKITTVSLENSETFFGYYDKSPLNSKGKLLFHAAPKLTYKKPHHVSEVEIIISDIDDPGTPIVKTKSKAFNWQQGSRVHWLNDDHFIYNDFDKTKKVFQSVIYSVKENKKIRIIDKPVQDSYKDVYFLSINYSRLQALRPDYGYSNLPKLTNDQIALLENDGIWYCDIKSGEFKLLFSLNDIVNTERDARFDESIHWVNHLMISPDGLKFIFIHRFTFRKKIYSRLLCVDLNREKLSVVCNNEMVSHCCWKDNENIIGFLRGHDNTDNYWFINVDSRKHSKYQTNNDDKFGDGHPNILGDYLLFDTYPDKSRMQHLQLSHLKTGEIIKLGSFYIPFKYFKETRCDLHPRFSPCGKFVFFDSTHSGERNLYFINLQKNNINL